MNRRKLAIAFFGPDGSGKTTLAKLLRTVLLGKYGNIKVFWMRGMHTVALLVGLFLSKFPSMKGTDVPFLKIRLIHKNVWCLLEVVSLLPIIIKFELLKLLYPVIIAERCHIDSAVWLWMHYGSSSLCRAVSSLLLKIGINNFDILIHTTADLDVLLKRRQNEALNREFLLKQQLLYEAYYKVLRRLLDLNDKTKTICFVDTSKNEISETLLKVLSCLHSYVNS